MVKDFMFTQRKRGNLAILFNEIILALQEAQILS